MSKFYINLDELLEKAKGTDAYFSIKSIATGLPITMVTEKIEEVVDGESIKANSKYPVITIVGDSCEIHSKTISDYNAFITDIKKEAFEEALPCKADQTLYVIFQTPKRRSAIIAYKIQTFEYCPLTQKFSLHLHQEKVGDAPFDCTVSEDWIGDVVFFTPEDAKKRWKMKKKEEKDDLQGMRSENVLG